MFHIKDNVPFYNSYGFYLESYVPFNNNLGWGLGWADFLLFCLKKWKRGNCFSRCYLWRCWYRQGCDREVILSIRAEKRLLKILNEREKSSLLHIWNCNKRRTVRVCELGVVYMWRGKKYFKHNIKQQFHIFLTLQFIAFTTWYVISLTSFCLAKKATKANRVNQYDHFIYLWFIQNTHAF